MADRTKQFADLTFPDRGVDQSTELELQPVQTAAEAVNVRACEPGTCFETRDGRRWVVICPNHIRRVVSLENGQLSTIEDAAGTAASPVPARPLTPVPVSGRLGADLRGLLLACLETGTEDALAALHDYLTETRFADRTLAEAVRANERNKCVGILEASSLRIAAAILRPLPPPD